ncbi:TIGR03619 family F420-dependent LLM class oxidoreductase [Streptomyces rugosispiralis]|uniref:TIGR03619 family F420-dependent LLM class oxidoreductase n=1 Tax=Streptomyces rugosispiralis TaxID=2967341 RepID=A0ABT1V907_9ACTN|nr:TIGR03619 family F420-dependent LLM class oxidoreductase [Streptomyces rugosispiralis]MCQ8193880.1 TIGR03619 family F420-dependent LLM class oxidoreductase [Streptomyces rugosispiralis]
MKFSVALPQSNRVGDTAAIRDVAQAAEELGFWAVSMHDHIVFDGMWLGCGAEDDEGRSDRRTVFEQLTTFGYVAGTTSTIRLMTSVMLLPARETILAAKQVATLDQLSGGRMVVGVGVGLSGTDRDPQVLETLSRNAAVEMAALGVDVTSRGRLADEQLAALRRIWTDDTASYDGELIRFNGIDVFPKPAQAGGPPILIAGNTPAALRRTARGGYSWLPNHATPAEVVGGLASLAELGYRPPECVLNVFWRMDDTAAAARAACRGTLEDSFGDHLPVRNLVGTPDEIAARCQEYRDAGASVIDVKPVFRSVKELIGMLETFMTEVAPTV